MTVLSSFRGLYFATLLMLLGSGLLSTYLALNVADRASGIWVGAMMSSFYLGLVSGGKLGHRLIARVGHIRAYTASAGIITAAVLTHGLHDSLWIWLVLRLISGLGMMCLYMVVESWLNEQSTSENRGRVFSGYMMASFIGSVIGQLIQASLAELNTELLTLVALCFSLCLVPVALTRRIHPEPLKPASLSPRYFYQLVPIAMFTSLIAGSLVGTFYGLGPLYAARIGLPAHQVGLFMAACISAGVLIQAPMGYLSDNIDRSKLIRGCSILLLLVAMPQAIEVNWPIWAIFTMGALTCSLLFSLYPLAVAFANDNIAAEKRVSLAAVLLTTFGFGASIGPLLIGALMGALGPNMLFVYFCLSAAVVAMRIRPQQVTGDTQVEEAPLPHLSIPDGVASSPLAAALDPRVEEEFVQEHMYEHSSEGAEEEVEEKLY